MPLPEPILDDLRFQHDLVDEARRRIIRYCPEWTDYNLSDPGITLIELFAWMTELITYRLNRVPEKNYLRFLNMLGVQLQPASPARAELTFWLSVPFPVTPEDTTTATVPQGAEIATRRAEDEPEIIFTTDETLTITGPRLTQLRRADDVNRNYLPRLGLDIFYAFNQEQPQIGDTFYLGFDADLPLNGRILQLTFECEETQATGIRREDPPLVWECSLGHGAWEVVEPSTRRGEKNTTGGLNNPTGKLVLYLPLTMQPDEMHGRRAYWVRCRFEARRPEQGTYTRAPRIRGITPHVLGGSVWATHARFCEHELLGMSNGEAGQRLVLQHAPILEPRPTEMLEVEELRDGEPVFIPWRRVHDFAESTRYDRHYTLEPATGEIAFGPAIRQRDGAVRQYGRIPPNEQHIRFSAYRYGGGAVGNVPADKLQVMRTSLAYIDRVTNLRRAEGGRDQENLEEAQLRARRELRAQQRAVTAEDYEHLGRQASRAIARIKCLSPAQVGDGLLPPGQLELLVIPAAVEALKVGNLAKLWLEPHLRDELRAYLDRYRLLTTTLHIREPGYLGVSIAAEVAPAEYSAPETVRQRVLERLNQFLTPLAWDEDENLSELLGSPWEGWPFGRNLYVSELFALIQQVPGVKHVLDVKVRYQTLSITREAAAPENNAGEEASPLPAADALTLLEGRMLEVPRDAVLCSLPHEIRMVQL